jgi:ubiquinol-cytochrome c reductase cytochrome c subunit
MSRSVCVNAAALGLSLLFASGAVLAQSAENGQRAYMKFGCWQCHGTVGQGAVTGIRLAPDPLRYERFVDFVRTTKRTMPPYREAVLSNQDLADIYAYLESIPRATDYRSIPLLNQQR